MNDDVINSIASALPCTTNCAEIAGLIDSAAIISAHEGRFTITGQDIRKAMQEAYGSSLNDECE